MNRTLVRNARHDGAPVDILIEDGRIASLGAGIGAGLEGSVQQTLDAAGGMVLPAFVESHIHLDKAFVADRAPGLSSAGPSPQALMAEVKREFTVEDIYARARRSLEQGRRHGCLAMRAYVEIDPFVELRGVEAMLRLKADFAGEVDLQLVAFAQEGIYQDEVTQGLLVEGLDQGLELLGGCPYMDPGREREHIDWCFDLAERRGIALDFHADTADEPGALTSDYIVEQVRARAMQGQVQIGHLCTMDVMRPDDRARLIEALRETQTHVVSLPATEAHVKGRTDPSRTWRGVTRIGEMHRAGVNVAVATNNVVNPFTPYGHADLLRQLLITAMTAHLGNLEDMQSLSALVTTNPARAIGVEGYGLAKGCQADLVILDAPDLVTAIIEQVEKTYVIKAGRVVVHNTRHTETYPG